MKRNGPAHVNETLRRKKTYVKTNVTDGGVTELFLRLDRIRLMEASSSLSLLPEAADDPVGTVRSGLPYASFGRVREALDAPDALLAQALAVSERTLYRRRRNESRLGPEASDRLLLLSETFEMAVRAFDDEEQARHWLREPHSLLGGERPLEHMDTVAGTREVQTMLQSIEHSMPV